MDRHATKIERDVVSVRFRDLVVCRIKRGIHGSLQIDISAIEAHEVLVLPTDDAVAGERAARHLKTAARVTHRIGFAKVSPERNGAVHRHRTAVKVIDQGTALAAAVVTQIERIESGCATPLPEVIRHDISSLGDLEPSSRHRRTIFDEKMRLSSFIRPR